VGAGGGFWYHVPAPPPTGQASLVFFGELGFLAFIYLFIHPSTYFFLYHFVF
jgi:hypothetical protein